MDPDLAIGERLARRDEQALEDAYAVYGASLLAYLRRYVGPDEAEDVLQRTFLDVWRGAGRFRSGERFSSWLFTIAHRRAVDTLRSRDRAVVDVNTMREELADAVVGHALLTRAATTLGAAGETSELPPLSRPRTVARRRRALVAVAAAVVVGLGATGAVWWRSAPSAGPGSAIEAPLSPVATAGPGRGSVRMVEEHGQTTMTISVRGLPAATGGHFYYAWLLDPTTNKMFALGLVDPSSGSSFDLADAVVESYSAVDVSLETDDGDPAHSVTSVLRGSYEPDQITTAERKS